uniref:Ribonuclease H-like domain-containing protein n=1 Tax=Tanacetum cinerariifolium TaxID=118510 RepID=A0A699IE52_TANCI|nr:ribonuclease H-like domain-containing protein [Tanacetum cinerariifolium]
MKMEHYLSHTDYLIWQVIHNSNGPISVITYTNGMIKVLPPKTAEEVVARERERKAMTTLLMALPEDHLAKFHKMADAKEMWEAIKSIFGSTDESKKMQKYLLKQQFEVFSVSASKGLHKGTKPGLDTLSFDDLYSNLRVFECDVKGTTSSSSSNTQYVAFMSADNTSSTNDVSTTYSVSSPFVSKSQKEGSSSYIDEVIHSFFINQSSAPQLVCDDLEQINDDDLEETDLKWQVAMISMRIKKFHKRTEALKEKEDLKTKVENWQNSSKNLNRLLNTQMSANDNLGLGYGDYRYGSILSYKNKVLQSVFMNKGCDLENTPVNDRYVKGMHAVPPPMTGNYMPSGPDIVYEPKVWTDASIIEEYESDSDDDSVSNVQENIEKPSFAFTDSVKHVKSPRENVKETGTPNHYPKIEKQDRHSHTRKGLDYTFTRKSFFVCGSFSHLIRDCNFHEKRMAKQVALTKSKEKVTGQQAYRLVWNNVKRVNHHNKFVPTALLTKIGKIPVNAARKNFTRQEALTSTTSKVNIARPFMNETRPTRWNKAHLANYQELKGGSVAFEGSYGRITGKGKIKVGRKGSNTKPLVRPRKFSWVYFLKSKDETTPILKDFIRQARNQFNHKVKTIRIDNGTKFKNQELIEFCGLKGIKREYSNARTPQQNKVAERKNMTLIEAARTMLADLFLPTTFL